MRKVKCTNFTIRTADINVEINLTLIARLFDEVKQEVNVCYFTFSCYWNTQLNHVDSLKIYSLSQQYRNLNYNSLDQPGINSLTCFYLMRFSGTQFK